MLTVFEKIPDFFIERYDEELQAWGKNFRAIGPVKTFVLKEGHFADISPDPELGAVLLGCRLIARMERGFTGRPPKMTVSPFDERDERIIANHCEKMIKLGIHPRQFWKEPPRPGMPFPTINHPGKAN